MSTESCTIELFGGLTVRRGERTIARFETRKVAALLACLCLPLERAHSREVLAEQIWPDENWEATRSRLRQTLSWLRQHLEPPGTPSGSVLIADRAEVRLDTSQVTTDVAQFDSALRVAAQSADVAGRIPSLRKAIYLYRGELLPGYYEEAILRERERLAETHRQALGQLASSLAETGDLPGAMEIARRRVQQDSLSEDAHCQLIDLLASAGRMADAVRQYQELERMLHESLGVSPSAATRNLIKQWRGKRPTVAGLSDSSSTGQPSPDPATAPEGERKSGGEGARKAEQLALDPMTEPEGGAVPLDSPFYVERPTDAAFHAAIARYDSLVLVKGARQVGKTSLLARGLQEARRDGAAVVTTDLQKLAPEQLETAASLFETFATMIIDQLDLDISLDAVWDTRRGWNVNFERFLRREVLGRLSGPLVWGLDEVDRLFSHSFSTVVFGLFRSWHNERSLNPDGPWSRLTLAIAYATEAHLFITDLNQSPFNVGTRLTLEDFTLAEVADLNRRYGMPLADQKAVDHYFRLVGGHPYLVRRGLHCMAVQGFDLDMLDSHAEREEGVFGDHLRRLFTALTRDPGLCDSVRAVLQGKPCPDSTSFYRLRSAGVLAGEAQEEARLRCGLYQTYLERHLR